MFKYSKNEIVEIANENDFILNNVEKVLRLSEILNYLFTTKHSQYLALKGGTAINLFVLNLPRLSVDIDFDYTMNDSKEKMMIRRNEIKEFICSYMIQEGYELSQNSKIYYSLDSLVFSYNTVSNSKDVIKIEINYSNRLHIMPIVFDKKIISIHYEISARRLDDLEVIGSKLSALISRTTPRDIYDFYNLLSCEQLDWNYIKKIAIFYICLGIDTPINFNDLFDKCIKRIEKINYNILRETLIPVLHKKEKINVEEFKLKVINRLHEIFTLNSTEELFIEKFNNGFFEQRLLFDDRIEVDLSKHPMVIWKINAIAKEYL